MQGGVTEITKQKRAKTKKRKEVQKLGLLLSNVGRMLDKYVVKHGLLSGQILSSWTDWRYRSFKNYQKERTVLRTKLLVLYALELAMPFISKNNTDKSKLDGLVPVPDDLVPQNVSSSGLTGNNASSSSTSVNTKTDPENNERESYEAIREAVLKGDQPLQDILSKSTCQDQLNDLDFGNQDEFNELDCWSDSEQFDKSDGSVGSEEKD